MALWQRAQVDALARRADVLLASCRAWADQVRRRSARAVHHVPVGSTIDVAGGDARLSEEGRDDFIVAAFGTGHPSRSMVHLAAALNALARHGHRPVLLNLGSGAPRPPDLAADVRIISPGALPGADISRMLSRAQLGLTPFVDGVSSRRTTVAAMMAHGIPLLGTSGVNTDEPFVNGTGCLELVPVDDIDGYAAAAVRLAADPRRRLAVGAAGLALYERSLAWPVIARRLREVLEYRR
jgi:glycosyltransferase involved in cell wall biosynthesis